MKRSAESRLADVRRLLAAAGEVYEGRSRIREAIAASTGLTLEGVEFGFASLERNATDAELYAFVAGAGEAESVHVILSANVFVAPLRAIALARAAATRVTVRPSPRDPVLARALIEAADDPAVTLVEERDVASVEAELIHVYGRAETLSQVRARVRPEVRVCGHGPGMGVAVLSADAAVIAAAQALALDVTAFDQRGCLSPRVAFVVGDAARAEAFAEALHEALTVLGRQVPRGRLFDEERSDTARWKDVMAFAGHLRSGEAHAVAVVPSFELAALPPPGRHLSIVALPTEATLRAAITSLSRFIVAVGSDDPLAPAPAHARRSRLGAMQRPPLDGPVDRRSP